MFLIVYVLNNLFIDGKNNKKKQNQIKARKKFIYLTYLKLLSKNHFKKRLIKTQKV